MVAAGRVNTRASLRFFIVAHRGPEVFAAIVPATPEVRMGVALTGNR